MQSSVVSIINTTYSSGYLPFFGKGKLFFPLFQRIFKVPCTKPEDAMVEQVKALSNYSCFESDEQCAYEVIRASY